MQMQMKTFLLLLAFILLFALAPLFMFGGPKAPPSAGLGAIVNFRKVSGMQYNPNTYRKPFQSVKRHLRQGPGLTSSVRQSLTPSPKGEGNTLRALETTPSPQVVFKGIVGNESITPLNPGVAANAGYILEVTNQQYTIYNKQGDSLMSLWDNNFYGIGPGAGGIYDPKILYDAINNRWIITTGDDGFGATLAVSVTDDPTENWYVYHTVSGDSAVGFQDYPCTGYSDSLLVISCNDFINYYGKTSQPDYTYNSFFAINKLDAYNGILSYIQVIDTQKSGLYPAQNFDNTDTVWNVAYCESYQGSAYYYISYFTRGMKPVYHAAKMYGYPVGGNYSINSEAPQQGTANDIYTGDGRIEPAPSIRNGRLLFCNTMSGPDTGTPFYNYVQWLQVKPDNGSIIQQGQIQYPAGFTTCFFPSITSNNKGDLCLGYNVTSDTNYISAAYSYHRSTDAAGFMSPPLIYAPGVSPYYVNFDIAFEPNRWGDNNMLAYDSSTDGFVGVFEISNDTNAAGQRVWTTGRYGDNRGAIFEYSPVNCMAPTGLITKDITSNAITFEWQNVPGVNKYLFNDNYVPYALYNFPYPYYLNGTNDSFTIAGLPSNYTLYWDVQAVCDNDTLASAIDSAKTLNSPCGDPQLSVSDISDTGALLTIAPDSLVDEYGIIYASDYAGWTGLALGYANSIHLDTLRACSNFYAITDQVCYLGGDDWFYYFYQPLEFTTACTDTLQIPVTDNMKNMYEPDFKLYPVPAAGYVNIETWFTSNFELEVLNMLGQRISVYEFDGSGIHTVSTAALARGTYVARLKVNGDVFSKLFVVEYEP
jgi:hypothetical protein